MSKQYIVVENEGQKWLRTVNPHPEKISTHGTPEAFYYNPEWQNFVNRSVDLVYIGNHPAGTKLDENQIQEAVSWAIPVGEVSYADTDSLSKQPVKDKQPDLSVVGDLQIKPFKVANVRPLVNQMLAEEISFSRFVEILNEIANDKHIYS